MPFIRTSYRQDQYRPDQLKACADSLSESLIEHFRIPPDDFFHLFHAIEPGGFFFSPNYLGAARSDRLLFIEITLGSGRSRERKQNFYRDAAQRLGDRCGIRQDDILIMLVETQPEDWSFGLGRAQMIDDPPVWLEEPDRSLKTAAGQSYAAVSPAFADYTQRILFGEVWNDPAISPRERSLITLAALVSAGQTAQIPYHMDLAKEHGLNENELSAVFAHLAFYAGWPKAAAALDLLKRQAD